MKKFVNTLFFLAIGFSCREPEHNCVYKEDVMNFYMQLAFGRTNDFSNAYPIVKWVTNIKVRVFGYPTQTDIAEVERIIAELNELQDEILISLTDQQDFNTQIHFIPQIKFDSIINITNASLYNGLTSPTLSDYKIVLVIICVNSSENHIPTRNHVIRHELTHALGLPGHSKLYPNSVLWDGGGYINNEYLDVDKLAIQMHYSSVVEPGMTAEQVEKLVCWK
jgi:hypothetical protein